MDDIHGRDENGAAKVSGIGTTDRVSAARASVGPNMRSVEPRVTNYCSRDHNRHSRRKFFGSSFNGKTWAFGPHFGRSTRPLPAILGYMRWKDYIEKRVIDNVLACQRIIGKPLTVGEHSQVRSQVERVMKHERKQSFRRLVQR